MSGYDGHFILRYLYDNGGFNQPQVIMNGTKIISMHIVKRFKVIDSLNYFQCSLTNLTKMFELPVYKGFYPHLFNTIENEDYIGSIPDSKYFLSR